MSKTIILGFLFIELIRNNVNVELNNERGFVNFKRLKTYNPTNLYSFSVKLLHIYMYFFMSIKIKAFSINSYLLGF